MEVRRPFARAADTMWHGVTFPAGLQLIRRFIFKLKTRRDRRAALSILSRTYGVQCLIMSTQTARVPHMASLSSCHGVLRHLGLKHDVPGLQHLYVGIYKLVPQFT